MNIEELNQEQAQSLLNTKSIHEQIADLGNAAATGWLNPLEVYVELKRIETTLQNAFNAIKDDAILNAEIQDGKEFKMFGAKIAVRNSGSRWDFSSVTKYNDVMEQKKRIEALAKNAAAEFKHGNKIFDDDGVEIEPAIYNEGKTNIFVSLEKN